jgi:lipopolysaccharide assembly outer membrane protein LptD (OstA)
VNVRAPRSLKFGASLISAAIAGGFAAGMRLTALAAPASTTHAVRIKGDLSDRKESAAGTIDTLSGHARITSEDTVMTSDLATFNELTGIANSPGRVEINDPQNTVVGDTGVAYYKRRDARISGNVRITVRPKPGAQNAPEGSLRREFKQPVYITCDNVDYNWRTRVAIATGHLTFKLSDRTVTATQATYYGNDERVVLDGKVHYTRTNGDVGDSPYAIAILKEGAEQFTTPHGGEAIINIKDEEDGAAAPPPPATPAAAAKRPGNRRPPAATPPTTGPTPGESPPASLPAPAPLKPPTAAP